MAQFLDETETQFVAMLPKLPLHPGSKTHLFNKLMPALATIAAAYRVLKHHGYTIEQIGRLEYEGYLQHFNKIPKPIRGLARRFIVSPMFSRLMWPTINKMAASGREDTFVIEYAFQKKPYRATTMTCTQCGMIALMEKNGLEELKGCATSSTSRRQKPSGSASGSRPALVRGTPHADTSLPTAKTTLSGHRMWSP